MNDKIEWWEYRVEGFPNMAYTEIPVALAAQQARLDELGRERWELVSVDAVAGYGNTFYLKRRMTA